MEMRGDSGHREESEEIYVSKCKRQRRLISCFQGNWSCIGGFNKTLAKNTYF